MTTKTTAQLLSLFTTSTSIYPLFSSPLLGNGKGGACPHLMTSNIYRDKSLQSWTSSAEFFFMRAPWKMLFVPEFICFGDLFCRIACPRRDV